MLFRSVNNNVNIVTVSTDMGALGCGTVTTTVTGIGDETAISGTYSTVDSKGACDGNGIITMTR